KPDEEGNSAYRNLLSCLSNIDLKKELHRSVERLCRQFIKLIQGKSIDWLRNTPLPLYHFLRGISEPFVPIEMNLEMEWTFWQTIKDNKRSFHKYLQEKDSRFKDIYLSLEDLMKFDPVLMKVVLYLCPEDQLHTIIPLAPPFLITSYLIHIYKDKGIKENVASLLNLCIKNLEISLSQLEKEEWRTNADKLYQISVKLIEIVFKKIQSTEKHHQTVLFAIINYYLYLVSKMYENEEEPDTKSHIKKMLDILISWFNHHHVIGGSSFGGATGIKQQKVKEELQIWISLYECVKCPECISDLWTRQLKALLEARTEEVSSNKSKVAVFLEVVKHENCPEGIVDIFIVTALNGLASLKGNVSMSNV
uniref:Uncharacterized protein n=1 Tax=Amphimedon queenslandica TaxID=400682 RepID=A0A1X7VJE0_AMPQE